MPSAPVLRRVNGVLARMSVRERMVVVLLLVERLRPLEAAVALRLSVRQVERTRDHALARIARAARRAPARSVVQRRAA
jgi:DNA-directed RNA polymerase specialized sigma24 family protein